MFRLPDAPETGPRDALLVVAAAIVGRLPVLGAWWSGDDWALLGRAAGLVGGDATPWRFVSRELWWGGLHPLFGLNPDPWTWARLALHGAAAWLVLRLARRAGLGEAAALVAGLIFAATPLAFAPLYRAAGVQELLGATLALAAVDRLTASGRAAPWLGLFAGLAAVFAKENALLLGPFLLILARGGDPARRRARALVGGALTLAGAVAAVWLWRGAPHGPGTGHLLDPLAAIPENLALFGWWLASPAPTFAVETGPLVALGGIGLWALWLLVARAAWRRGERRPALALGAVALILLPALPVAMEPRPWLAYLAVAPAAITLCGLLLGDRDRPSTAIAVLMALTAALAAWGLTTTRLDRRDAAGRPADPLVLQTAVAHDAIRTLDAVDVAVAPEAAVLQIPGISTPGRSDLDAPATAPLPSVLYTALDGDLGPRLAGDPRRRVAFVRRLDATALDAHVFVDAGDRLRYWGPLAQAFVYHTLVLVALDRHDEAVHALGQAMRNSRPTMPFVFDESQLPVPLDRVRAGSRAFLSRIRTADALRDAERDAVLETALELLSRCHVTP